MQINSAVRDSELKRKSIEESNLLQTEQWGIFKSGASWSYDFARILDDNAYEVGYFLALFRKTPMGVLAYLPHGPVIYDWDQADASELKNCLINYSRSRNLMNITIDPMIIRTSTPPSGLIIRSSESERIADKLKASGFIHSGYNRGLDAGTQPRFQAVVYREDYEKGNKKLSQYCRIASRRGVEVDIFSGDNVQNAVESFFDILHKTEQRKGIHLRSVDYFRNMADTLDNVELYLGKIDIPSLRSKNEMKIKATQDQINLAKSKKTLNKLNETLASLEKERIALKSASELSPSQTPYISCALTVTCGHTAELLYAGFDETYKHFQPAYLTWQIAVQHCFNNGALAVNLGGITGYDDDPLLCFKKNFNPTIEEYIGEFNLPIKPLRYSLFNTALKLYKRIL